MTQQQIAPKRNVTLNLSGCWAGVAAQDMPAAPAPMITTCFFPSLRRGSEDLVTENLEKAFVARSDLALSNLKAADSSCAEDADSSSEGKGKRSFKKVYLVLYHTAQE